MDKIKFSCSILINIIVFVLPLKLSFMSSYFSPSRIDMTFFFGTDQILYVLNVVKVRGKFFWNLKKKFLNSDQINLNYYKRGVCL